METRRLHWSEWGHYDASGTISAISLFSVYVTYMTLPAVVA